MAALFYLAKLSFPTLYPTRMTFFGKILLGMRGYADIVLAIAVHIIIPTIMLTPDIDVRAPPQPVPELFRTIRHQIIQIDNATFHRRRQFRWPTRKLIPINGPLYGRLGFIKNPSCLGGHLLNQKIGILVHECIQIQSHYFPFNIAKKCHLLY